MHYHLFFGFPSAPDWSWRELYDHYVPASSEAKPQSKLNSVRFSIQSTLTYLLTYLVTYLHR